MEETVKTNKYPLGVNGVKTYTFFRHIIKLFLVLIVGCLLFNGCAALEEAQQIREKRMAEKRETFATLAPSKGKTEIDKEGKKAGSQHYTLKFAADMESHEDFGEPEKRSEYLASALVYMESLYNELYDRFGFQPKYKIDVTIYKNYRQNRAADTRKEYTYTNTEKTLNSIAMNFPLNMFQDMGTRAHELTHAFTSAYFLPTWFDEGIAVMIQTEFAKSRSHPKFDSLEQNLERNMDGVNSLEDWEAGGNPRLTQWRYSYAYTIIAELQKRCGADFYIKVFELMEADQLHNKLPSRMSTSFLIYYLNQASETDLIPFFESLHFKVRRLTKEDILQNIRQANR